MVKTKSQFGVGLRPTHFSFIEESITSDSNIDIQIDWFEAVSENYMDTQGRPLRILEMVRKNFPVALHGVGMSIGCVEGLNEKYLERLKKLIDRIDPFIVSDHLCWTGTKNIPTHDLLPLPYTQEALNILRSNIDKAQDFLQRQICLENVSSYMSYKSSEMTEWEFIFELQKSTGCGLLLDINNVFVSSQNHGFNGEDFISSIDLTAVKQIHLAGHTDMGEFLFDTHTGLVCDEVWELVRFARNRFLELDHHPAIMVEWDDDIPEWHVLENEALKAKNVWSETL